MSSSAAAKLAAALAAFSAKPSAPVGGAARRGVTAAAQKKKGAPPHAHGHAPASAGTKAASTKHEEKENENEKRKAEEAQKIKKAEAEAEEEARKRNADGSRPLTDAEYEAAIEEDASLEAASKRLYRERIRSLPAAFDEPKTVEWCLSHPDQTWAALKAVRVTRRGGERTGLSDETLRSDASTAVGLFRRLPGLQRRLPEAHDRWRQLAAEATEVASAKYEDIRPSERQRAAHVEWSEVLAKRDELLRARASVPSHSHSPGASKPGGPKALASRARGIPKPRGKPDDDDDDGDDGDLDGKAPKDAALLLSLLTYVAPSRADWGAVRVFEMPRDAAELPEVGGEAEKSLNYLILPGGKGQENGNGKGQGQALVVWNRYKTWKVYGRVERELPAELEAVVRASLAARPRRWLVEAKDGGPHTNRSFAARAAYVLGRLFGRPATLDTLRHSYVNGAKLFEMTPRQMEAMAKDMRHSPSMLSRYRLRFEDTDGEEVQGSRTCDMEVRCPPYKFTAPR